MQDESYHPLGPLNGAEVGVQPTPAGQDILIQHTDAGQRLARLLQPEGAHTVLRGGTVFWRIAHNRQVDDLIVELIDLLISIRYAHPAMVQLEMILEPDQP